MNQTERRKLKAHANTLEEVQVAIDELVQDLEDRLSNLQDHFTESPTIEKLEEEAGHLQDALDDLAGAISSLDEVVD